MSISQWRIRVGVHGGSIHFFFDRLFSLQRFSVLGVVRHQFFFLTQFEMKKCTKINKKRTKGGRDCQGELLICLISVTFFTDWGCKLCILALRMT